MQGHERRQHSRHPYYAKVSVAGTVLGYLRNVSEGGAKVSVIKRAAFSTGDVLSIQTIGDVPEDLKFTAPCQVMWLRNMGPYCDIGISFSVGDDAMRERIVRFADALEQRYGLGELPPHIEVEMMKKQPPA